MSKKKNTMGMSKKQVYIIAGILAVFVLIFSAALIIQKLNDFSITGTWIGIDDQDNMKMVFTESGKLKITNSDNDYKIDLIYTMDSDEEQITITNDEQGILDSCPITLSRNKLVLEYNGVVYKMERK